MADEAAAAAPRRRRRRLVVAGTAVVLILVTAVVAVLVWVRRDPIGAQVAAESDGFTRCQELRSGGQDDGIGLDGAEDFDREQEQRFWSRPVAHGCAVARFEEPVRARALQVAFPAPEEGADIEAQWQVVRDYATWLVEQEGADSAEVLLRVGAVLTALWVAEVDDDLIATGSADIAVLADMSARGELPGYRPWLQENDRTDDVSALDDYRDSDLVEDRPENEAPYRLYRDRSTALLYAVR